MLWNILKVKYIGTYVYFFSLKCDLVLLFSLYCKLSKTNKQLRFFYLKTLLFSMKIRYNITVALQINIFKNLSYNLKTYILSILNIQNIYQYAFLLPTHFTTYFKFICNKVKINFTTLRIKIPTLMYFFIFRLRFSERNGKCMHFTMMFFLYIR